MLAGSRAAWQGRFPFRARERRTAEEVGLVAGEIGGGAGDIELAGQPGVEALLGDAKGILPRGDGALEDADFRVERANIVISARDIRGDAQKRVMKVGQGGLRGARARLPVAADAAEEIEFPIQIDREAEDVVGAGERLGIEDERAVARGASAGGGALGGNGEGIVADEFAALERGRVGEALADGAGLGIEVREEIGGGDTNLGPDFADAIDGERDVLIGADAPGLRCGRERGRGRPSTNRRELGVARLGFFPRRDS